MVVARSLRVELVVKNGNMSLLVLPYVREAAVLGIFMKPVRRSSKSPHRQCAGPDAVVPNGHCMVRNLCDTPLSRCRAKLSTLII